MRGVPADRYIPLKEIARRQEISEKYLEAIIKILVKAKLLSGVRGKGGGYKLTRTPGQYTDGSILRLTEDSLAPVTCLEENAAPCSRAANCLALPLWQGLDRVISEYLDSITLADLLQWVSPGRECIIFCVNGRGKKVESPRLFL